MTDQEEQLARFREAVERKAAKAERASHEHPHENAPHVSGHAEPSHSPREKGHGKDKMTADKWNQNR